MNRLSIFRGLRKSTAVTKPDNGPKPLPELPSPEPDNNSLHRPSSHISRTTANTAARQSFQTAVTRVSRHSAIPSVSSIEPDPSSTTALDALPGFSSRISGDRSFGKLLNYLHGHDTALALAINFLGATNKQCDEYLRLHQARSDGHQRRNWRSSRINDVKTSHTAVSIEITLEEVEARHYEAYQLLEILAFFDNRHVCYEIFRAARSAPPTIIRETVSSHAAFDNALAPLQRFGIVEVTNWYYHVQPQIHSWVLRRCMKSSPTQALSFSKYASRCIVDAFESTNRTFTWYQCLIHHAEHLTALKIFDFWLNNSLEDEIFACIEGLARVLTGFGRDHRVEQMFQKILGHQQKRLGLAHPATCKTMWQLGRQHADRKEYMQADALLNSALAGFEQVPGYEEYVTWSLIDLAKVYRHQRIFVESEKMLRLARHGLFNVAERFRNPRQVLEINVELGKLYREQGRLEEAERMLRQAVSYAEERNLGTSRCKVQLGSLHLEQGKLLFAETCLEQALIDHQRSSGLDEQDLQTIVTNLSFIYGANGQPERAAQLHGRFDSNLNIIHIPRGQVINEYTQNYHNGYNNNQQRPHYMNHYEMPP